MSGRQRDTTGNDKGKVEKLRQEIKDLRAQVKALKKASSVNKYVKKASYDMDITGHEQAYDLLKESEERFRALFDASFGGIGIHDKGVILYCNQGLAEITGFSVEELIGMNGLLLIAPKWRELVMERILSGYDKTYDVEGARKDLSIYPLEIIGKNIPYHGRTLRVTEFRDLTERKRVEEALHESEERYRRIAAAVTDYIYTVHVEGGRVLRTDHSAACEAVTGYGVDEFTADPYLWFTMVTEQDRSMVQRHFDRVAAGEEMGPIEHRIHRKDGSIRWVFNMPVVHRSADGTIISYDGVVSDITERKLAEEALRQSQEMLRLVLDTIPVRVFWKDRDSVYLGCNRVFAYDSGLNSPDEIIGKDDFEMGWAEQAHRYREDDALVMETGVAKLGYEEPQTTSAGSRRWLRTSKIPLFDSAGNITGVLGTYEDITERKQAEEALKGSEERYRLMAELTGKLVYDCDVPTGRITWHGSIFQLTGFMPQELETVDIKAFNEMIHPEDRAQTISILDAALNVCGPYTAEYRIHKKDGTYIYVEDHGIFLPDEAGRAFRMLGSLGDITDRKKAHELKLEMERRMLHAQKLESLGVMAGGIAHDFNNLLMAILGNLDLARLDLSPVSRSKPFLDQAMVATRRAADLTNQMLAYSGKGRFNLKPFDLSELVEEMSHLLRASISRTVTLDLEMDGNLPPIIADLSQIQQIIMNLIVNASEAIGDHPGVVTITTGVMECDETGLKKSRLKEKPEPGMFVFFEVKDTGCGMDEETRDRLFDPFFTTKFTGRGLGMAAAQGIIRGHRGAIMVESEPGRGTTIRVLFPSAHERKPVKAQRPDASANDGEATAAMPSSGTVLVADDEEMVLNLCRSMLERLGFKVLTASDGDEAIRLFLEHAPLICCVILDLTMPKLAGMAAFEELRRIKKDVKVILSSGYNEQELTQRFYGRGLAGFIKKPYELSNLRKELNRVLKDL